MTRADPFHTRLASRHRLGWLFSLACAAATWASLLILAVLLAGVIWMGGGRFTWQFLSSFDSYKPEQAGILAGLWGSIWVICLTALFAVPVGIGAAVYLEEYARPTRLTRFIQVNLSNLAGVPSIVYGILGLTVFVYMFGLFGAQPKTLEIGLGFMSLEIPVPFGRTVLSAALTMALLILPVIIIASQESLRAVPPSIRHGSLALGATQWQTIRHQVLPAAIPGIMTGIILSLSRAFGETAPLIVVGAVAYVSSTPGRIDTLWSALAHPGRMLEAPFDRYTTIPMQVYTWVKNPDPAYQQNAAAGILVLLVVLLMFNGTAILIRHRTQSKIRW